MKRYPLANAVLAALAALLLPELGCVEVPDAPRPNAGIFDAASDAEDAGGDPTEEDNNAAADVEPDVVEDAVEMTSGLVSGRVVRASDFTPIINAEVSTLPPTDRLFTDADGRFVITSSLFLNQTHTMLVKKGGFVTAEVSIIFESGSSRMFNIALCHADGEPLCNGEDGDCDGRIDEGLLNACGGCEDLDQAPFEACGETCGMVWTCDGIDALSCDPAEGEVCGNSADDDCDEETDELECTDPGGG